MSVLILASASPRRHELLSRVGVRLEIVPSTIDEAPREGERPRAYASRLAAEKALAAARLRPATWILAADTIVLAQGKILGKPSGQDEARTMLRLLAGRTHVVMTAFCLLAPTGAISCEEIETEVDMRPLSETEVAAYVASGEWEGKAGGYAAQGIAAAFIRTIRGSYTNVVGLPLAEVIEALARAGAPGADLANGVPS